MFYWDDETLGDKPSHGQFGSFNHRQTQLIEGGPEILIVRYLDDQEVCHIQTLAYLAAEIGYANLADFLLENIETPAVRDFLKSDEPLTIIRQEFDYLKHDHQDLFKMSERLQEENIRLQILVEVLQNNMSELMGELEFQTQRADLYEQAYNDLLDDIETDEEDTPDFFRINAKGEPDDFGDWIFVDPPHKGGYIN